MVAGSGGVHPVTESVTHSMTGSDWVVDLTRNVAMRI